MMTGAGLGPKRKKLGDEGKKKPVLAPQTSGKGVFHLKLVGGKHGDFD